MNQDARAANNTTATARAPGAAAGSISQKIAHLLRRIAVVALMVPVVGVVLGLGLPYLIPGCRAYAQWGDSTCMLGSLDVADGLLVLGGAGLQVMFVVVVAIAVPLWLVAWCLDRWAQR